MIILQYKIFGKLKIAFGKWQIDNLPQKNQTISSTGNSLKNIIMLAPKKTFSTEYQ